MKRKRSDSNSSLSFLLTDHDDYDDFFHAEAPLPYNLTEPKDNAKLATSFITFLSACKDRTQLTDFTICCKDREWQVHRLVVSVQSDFFNAACNGSFMENSLRKVTLDDDPMIINCMIDYFYSLNYSDTARSADMPLTTNALVYVVADKYGTRGLQDAAVSKLLARLDLCKGSFEDLVSVIKLIWTSMPVSEKTLRTACFRKFWDFRKIILGIPEMVADLRSAGDFLVDVIQVQGP